MSPRDFKLGTDPETIESYLYESEEYHNGDLRLVKMEPATRIERVTCGLRNSATPTTDNQPHKKQQSRVLS